MSITVGTNSWCSLQEAMTYFETRYPSDSWDDAEEREQVAALVTAYNQLSALDGYSLIPGEATKLAQYEQAYFLLAFGDDVERRNALRSAGVKQVAFSGSGGMSEVFDGDGVVISASALAHLKDFKSEEAALVIGDLTRDDTIY